MLDRSFGCSFSPKCGFNQTPERSLFQFRVGRTVAYMPHGMGPIDRAAAPCTSFNTFVQSSNSRPSRVPVLLRT
jgi:hypothetical protein